MSGNDRPEWDAQDLIQWQEAHRWLAKADEDLVAAERLQVPLGGWRHEDHALFRGTSCPQAPLCLARVVRCSAYDTAAARDPGRRAHSPLIEVEDTRDGKSRILRVVTLEDGETIHNAFFDRNFVKDRP